MITDPSEQYFKDGLWGWTGTLWEKLKAFSNLLGIASHGWDGSVWRKEPIRLGFSSQYLELETDTGTGSLLSLTFSIVPSGELWVVEAFTTFPVDGDHPTPAFLSVYDGSNDHLFARVPSLSRNTMLAAETPLFLVAGDRLRVLFASGISGNEYRAYANGRKVLIAE
jgi:hypothetical protein